MIEPIIVDENGDITIFDSVLDATLKLEAIDVINGEYTLYDSAGNVLCATAESIDSPVQITTGPDMPSAPHVLRTILVDLIRRVGVDRFKISENDLRTFGLQQLISTVQAFQKLGTAGRD
jgi:hypothetical protein